MATSAAPTKPPVLFQGSRLTLELDLDSDALEQFVKERVNAVIHDQVAAALKLANSTATIA